MSLTPTSDEVFMRRAIELARRGLGFVEPNPAVGAVIVDDSRCVIGEGWHERFGGPHAEVNALAAAGEAARGATLFVSLEPCCHFGKTPPCTRAVVAAGIRRVVVGTVDPATHVRGGGIAELRAAGVEVDVGILETDAKRLIAPFATLMTSGRPWFHAKWAMTLDGKLASRTGSSQWISNETSRAVVHQLRGRMDAILVGVGTVLADDPLLTARPNGPRIATRIVLDSQCRTPLDSKLVKTARDAPLLVVATEAAPPDRRHALLSAGAEVLVSAVRANGRLDLDRLALEFGRRSMTNVLLEGGATVLGSFFDQSLLDEIHAFIAPMLVGGADARSPLAGDGLASMADATRLHEAEVRLLDGDVYVHGTTHQP
jgi:diaminohydroxyphosphoribosylaminopyrimidine deaminase / 5-amino-6-(5-phosphoribosylamino)uracil reductase